MKLYIVRHGESTGNRINAFVGQSDMPLTELGEKQAELAAGYLSAVPFTAAYSSDLIRAYRTAEIVARPHGLRVVPEKDLRELNVGEWNNMRYADIRVKYPGQFELWCEKIHESHPPQGETVQDLDARVWKCFTRIVAENAADANILVGTHATPLKVILARVMGLPLERLGELDWTPNASTTIVDYTDGKFAVERMGIDEYLGDTVTGIDLTK